MSTKTSNCLWPPIFSAFLSCEPFGSGIEEQIPVFPGWIKVPVLSLVPKLHTIWSLCTVLTIIDSKFEWELSPQQNCVANWKSHIRSESSDDPCYVKITGRHKGFYTIWISGKILYNNIMRSSLPSVFRHIAAKIVTFCRIWKSHKK